MSSPFSHAGSEIPLNELPLLPPMRMRPSYRHGDMTPWGGDSLQTVFHKSIPDNRTGEALEISAVPGFESRDDNGAGLRDLMDRYGATMMGRYKEFPLLLKLIDAREKLSVQIHPQDTYAFASEGKLGKSEAWVVLRAQEGAHILYGMKPDAKLLELIAALEAEDDIEPLLNRVPVRAGDVFYIPCGMVHAIGEGVLLYEIQQSSDVTYRLWDYKRLNEKGEKRELHIREALDVMDLSLSGIKASLPARESRGIHRLLSVPAFTLDCACIVGEWPLAPYRESFRMLTALDALGLCWKEGEMKLAAGESLLLPANCPALWLNGAGRALIAAPQPLAMPAKARGNKQRKHAP